MYLAQLMVHWHKKFYSSSHCLSQLWQFQTAFSGNTCLIKTGNEGMLNPRLFHSTLGTLQIWVLSHGYAVAFSLYFPYLNRVVISKFRPMKPRAADCSTKSVFQPCHIYRHAELRYEMLFVFLSWKHEPRVLGKRLALYGQKGLHDLLTGKLLHN